MPPKISTTPTGNIVLEFALTKEGIAGAAKFILELSGAYWLAETFKNWLRK